MSQCIPAPFLCQLNTLYYRGLVLVVLYFNISDGDILNLMSVFDGWLWGVEP